MMRILDLWPEVIFLLALLLQLVFVLMLRTFPQVLVGSFLRKVDHRHNEKIERIRADYGTLKTSVDYLSAAQSKVQPRIVEAVEALWKAVLVVKKDYSSAVFATSIMTSQEINRCFQKPGEKLGDSILPKYRSLEDTMDSEAFRDSVSETSRLFVSDRLWLIFLSFRTAHGRLAYLFWRSFEEKKYHDWQSDRNMKVIFRNILPDKVVDEVIARKNGGFRDLADHVEAEFLKEARRVLYGSEALSELLSDNRAVLLLEQQELKEKGTPTAHHQRVGSRRNR